MITGEGDRTLLGRAFEAGVNFFLFKPIERHRILRLIRVSADSIEREARRFSRVKLRCNVALECESKRLTGTTLDISLGGLFVRVLAGASRGYQRDRQARNPRRAAAFALWRARRSRQRRRLHGSCSSTAPPPRIIARCRNSCFPTSSAERTKYEPSRRVRAALYRGVAVWYPSFRSRLRHSHRKARTLRTPFLVSRPQELDGKCLRIDWP